MSQFDLVQYTQCARVLEDLKKSYPLVLDPRLLEPEIRPKYVAPVYEWKNIIHTCVPVDACVGERVLAADITDSTWQPAVYEIVALDDVVGEEVAPHYPLDLVRKAILALVYVGTTHCERSLAERDAWNKLDHDLLNKLIRDRCATEEQYRAACIVAREFFTGQQDEQTLAVLATEHLVDTPSNAESENEAH